MVNTSTEFSFIGIALGAAALLLAITHFWADTMASQGTSLAGVKSDRFLPNLAH